MAAAQLPLDDAPSLRDGAFLRFQPDNPGGRIGPMAQVCAFGHVVAFFVKISITFYLLGPDIDKDTLFLLIKNLYIS